ncbi:MAG: tetratricopeptide repeat protein [Planctomycetes bacterium]|nr:tetratricopeptide repeat protein [Planctomycetota bacterium]
MNEVRPGAVGWRGRCGAAAIFLAVGCAYASTLGAGFAVDDERIVTHNRLIRHLGDLPTLFRRGFWDQERPGGRETSTDLAMKASYRPFTIASLSLNHALAAWLEGPSVCPHCRRLPDPPGGLDPWSYHLVNLLLHGLVSLLVADLALRLRLGPPGALFAGLLFALHPAHVDAVAWVSQRGELLSALFSVAALACHLRGAGARWAGPMFYAAALLSKESCLALPAVVWLCDLSAWMQARGALAGAPPAPVGGTGKHVPGFLRTLSWRLYAGYAGVVLAYLGVRVAVLGWLSVPAEIRYFAGVSRLDASLTVARFFTTEYLPGLLGAGVGSDYARPSYPDSGAADPLAWAGVLILVLLLSFALRGFARGSPAGLGVLMAALLLLPVTHLLAPLGVLGAARLLYLPSVGVCAFLGWGAGRAWDSGARTGRVSAALLVVAFGSATLVGARGWSSEGNAADRMLERTPDNPMALCNLASSLAAAGRGAEALPIFRQALALSPRQCVVWYNYGQLLFNLDRVDEGMEALRRGAAVDPDPSSALRLGEGRLRLRKKDLDGARQAFAEAAEMDPRSPTAGWGRGARRGTRIWGCCSGG